MAGTYGTTYPVNYTYWYPVAQVSAAATSEGYPRTLALIDGSTYDIGYTVGTLNMYSATLSANSALQTSTDYVFHPLTMAGRVYGTTNPQQYVGVLRQIKVGPPTTNGTLIKASGIEQSYFVSNDDNVLSGGIHLDMFE
jgi:hypothetical protein